MKITKYVVGLKNMVNKKDACCKIYSMLETIVLFHPSKQKFIKLLKYLHDFSKAFLLTQDIVHFYNIFGPPRLNRIPPSSCRTELQAEQLPISSVVLYIL